MLAVSEMKRTNVNLEKLALWFITQKKNSSFRLLSLVNENHFGNKGNLAAFKRIKFVAKKRNEIMSWDDVLEDSAVPEAARLILQSFEKTTQVNTSRATEIYNRLEELRKKRVVFDGLKELVEEKLLKNVDIDEIVNTDLSNILTKARSPELDDEFFIIGRGGNSEEIVENVLSKGLHYIPTGFNAWDKQNGGFTCPGVVLLGAHTSSGKSQMADTLAENFVDQGAKTCVTSLEMDIEELTVKRLARATGINQGKILLNDELSENDKQKIRKTFNERQKRWDKEDKALYTYVPKGNPTIEELLLRLQPKQFKIYIIDYITLLGDSGGDNQWRKLGEIVAYAKTFSRNNNCIVILLVQITQEQKLKYSQTMLEHCIGLDSYVHFNGKVLRFCDLNTKSLEKEKNKVFSGKTITATGERTIMKIHNFGEKDVNTITLDKGYSLSGTPTTKLLRLNSKFQMEWVETKEIKTGDHLAIKTNDYVWNKKTEYLDFSQHIVENVREKNYDLPEKMSSQFATIMGYMAAEGHTKSYIRKDTKIQANIIHFCNQNKDVCLEFAKNWKAVFGLDLNISKMNVSRTYEMKINSKHLHRYFEYLGITGTSRTKRVPWPVMQGTKKQVVAFLRAYFEGDGTAHNSAILATTYSEHLAKDIQMLLLKLGIVASVTKKTDNYVRMVVDKNNKSSYYWVISICGQNINRYKEDIGFFSTDKWKKVNTDHVYTKTNSEYVPYILGALAIHKVGKNSYTNEFGKTILIPVKSLVTLSGAKHGINRYNIGNEFYAQLSLHFPTVYKTLKLIQDNGLLFLPVIDKKKENKVVMDFTIENTNVQTLGEGNFIGNGMLVHNCDLAWFWVKDQTVIDTGIIQINTPKARKQKTITFPLKAEYEYARFTDVPDDYKPPEPKDIINPELKNKVKMGGNGKAKTKTGGDKLMDEYFPTKKKAA